jgi:hypothetical protein
MADDLLGDDRLEGGHREDLHRLEAGQHIKSL